MLGHPWCVLSGSHIGSHALMSPGFANRLAEDSLVIRRLRLLSQGLPTSCDSAQERRCAVSSVARLASLPRKAKPRIPQTRFQARQSRSMPQMELALRLGGACDTAVDRIFRGRELPRLSQLEQFCTMSDDKKTTTRPILHCRHRSPSRGNDCSALVRRRRPHSRSLHLSTDMQQLNRRLHVLHRGKGRPL